MASYNNDSQRDGHHFCAFAMQYRLVLALVFVVLAVVAQEEPRKSYYITHLKLLAYQIQTQQPLFFFSNLRA